MTHLKSILQSMMFALALAIGGIGTAAADAIGSADSDAATGDGVSAIDRHGPGEILKGSDKDDDDKDDDDSDW